MIRTCAFTFLLYILLPISFTAEGQEMPTAITCTSNAKASRDYGFAEKVWTGQKGHMIESSAPFQISTKDKKVKGLYLRDKVFSALNTEKPIVRSITRYEDGIEDSAEFVAKVVSRTSDQVFLVWTNNSNNKVWLATVDLAHRKAMVTQAFQGTTSVGGELETFDCR